MNRMCRKCEQEKPLASFPKRYGRNSHLREYTCGMCKRISFLARHPGYRKPEQDRRHAKAKGVSVEEYTLRRTERAERLPRIRRVPGHKCPVLRANPKIDYLVNRQYYLAKSKRWHQRNPDKALEKKRRRRSRIAGVIHDLTPAQWEAIKRAFSYRCAYCNGGDKLTMDHITPISKGGDHTVTNVVPACRSCNASKHAGPPPCVVQPVLLTI